MMNLILPAKELAKAIETTKAIDKQLSNGDEINLIHSLFTILVSEAMAGNTRIEIMQRVYDEKLLAHVKEVLEGLGYNVERCEYINHKSFVKEAAIIIVTLEPTSKEQ